MLHASPPPPPPQDQQEVVCAGGWAPPCACYAPCCGCMSWCTAVSPCYYNMRMGGGYGSSSSPMYPHAQQHATAGGVAADLRSQGNSLDSQEGNIRLIITFSSSDEEGERGDEQRRQRPAMHRRQKRQPPPLHDRAKPAHPPRHFAQRAIPRVYDPARYLDDQDVVRTSLLTEGTASQQEPYSVTP